MVFKSRMKWVGLVGLVLSTFSILTHFLLAGRTEDGISEFQSSITIFSWRPIFGNADLPRNKPLYKRLWGPVRPLESLHPHANPGSNYAEPNVETNGFVFVRIRGGFHDIKNSICDAVAVSRLLNATLVIPEIQSTTSSKGISSDFKSFAYLYNEDQFMAALSKDVKIVKTLPKNLKWSRRKKEIPSFRVAYLASPHFYFHHVLPILKKHSVVELVISGGGCLQAILPTHLEEYQRLRCRVAFHGLRFRQEVQELATKILNRLRAPGRPFIAYDPGMTRDAIAYHGCAELFQDVHTELIQHKRLWMIKRGLVKGKLSVNSAKRRLNGSCPLMPEEVGILLRAYGYAQDTIIYISGGEVFGGQRILIPLHAMFENVVDRTSLSAGWELSGIYGNEANTLTNYATVTAVEQDAKVDVWKTVGPRPRPLPPPPARPKTYNIEGWWGWVAESDNEPDSTIMELRTNAHKLLWDAIDYAVCIEADVFIPGFDRDGKGHPNFASLVMGHRLYQSAASKTFRPDRKRIFKLLEETRDNRYRANKTWITSVRRHLRETLLNGLAEASTRLKPMAFLAHPVPECSCMRHADLTKETSSRSLGPSTQFQALIALGVVHRCPAWMNADLTTTPRSRDRENEEDIDENDSTLSGLFFRRGDGKLEIGVGEISNKEEPHMDDTEELEGGER